MNPDFLARQSGVSVHSVIDYQQVGRTHILRIDRDKETRRRQALKARAEDVFAVDIIVDGVARRFPTRLITAELTDRFEDEAPGEMVWKLGGETYPPDSSFGVVAERVDFNVFERHSGSTVHDLSLPIVDWSRPWVAYGLAFLNPAGEFHFLWTEPVAGSLEVHLEDPVDNVMHLAGTFFDVHFDVPNLHFMLPETPNRPFEVDIPNGHYGISGIL